MKNFTAPRGIFSLSIPVEWQYINVAGGMEEKSPYCFQHYQESKSAFQISCYPKPAKWNNRIPDQQTNTDHLQFEQARTYDEEFNIHLWFANVEGHYFMAKFIYDAERAQTAEVAAELGQVTHALSTLQFLTGVARVVTMELDIYDKFIASLAASFDLRSRAFENMALIELVIIIANQIDAYLRMSIVLHKQLRDQTERIEVGLLRQEKGDRPIFEKQIYSMAADLEIISSELRDSLFSLYSERNKVVHRYIISEFNTRNLTHIVYEYDQVCEKVRLRLKYFEDLQVTQKAGIYAHKNPSGMPDAMAMDILFAQVNDKHLDKSLFRKINPEKQLINEKKE
ncbi:hypothetical protein AY601_2006 [Pedobacter cryoconitis]|uniref:Uncharacterized protein n=1 Tax=Pedobacter cryoconitis TaxID=188932 RepID=A0A127VBY6_9SPHI|nr:hypothetical protein [Pedobacter cryoconitis]AMP98912.1 hypothetical protein AY601_2006 [Pedobacter cryoconitis]